jgi:uncharacterized protein (UPF0332 family)
MSYETKDFMNIEEQIAKLKLERDTLSNDIDVKKSRLKEVEKTIKETEKFLEKAKEALNAKS